MSTLHKVKAYFGMAPMDDYDDEYYDDVDAPAPRRAPVEDRRYPRRGERFADDAEYGYDEPGYRAGGPAGYADEDRFVSRHAPSREFDRPAPRLGSLRGSAPTRGALAMDPRRAAIFDEGSPLSKITTLRPKDYSEARTIGERFATAPRSSWTWCRWITPMPSESWTSRPGWPSRCAVRSTRSPPRCSCCRRPIST